ncbi:hypothetical protein [Rubripirellula obstinata]|uniref:hypothetical protein n=1 Tax=Rubripirellula obstinata TaxID=406547 RepID=UPI00082D9EA7|nr:hypothetical protein [Rubripirellula obstinata]
MPVAVLPNSSGVVESGPKREPVPALVPVPELVPVTVPQQTAGAGSASRDAVSNHVADLFASVAWRVSAAWMAGCLALLLVVIAFAIGEKQFITSDQIIWVSLASGLITLASLVPGLVIGRGVPADKVARSGTAIVATSAALGIRFAGTVALFVACRYHFGEESSSIVFLVIGWYVFLTSIEVHGLAGGLTSLDRIQDFGRRDS